MGPVVDLRRTQRLCAEVLGRKVQGQPGQSGAMLQFKDTEGNIIGIHGHP